VTPKVLQQFDFAQGTLSEDLLAEDIGDFLDGNALVGLVVNGSAVGGRDDIISLCDGRRGQAR
jgi:hypothetical protein